MEDEVFEVYRKRIYATFIYPYLSEEEYDSCDETKLKEILEEIENNAKGEVLHQVFEKEAKP